MTRLEHLENLLNEGKISRRQFLTRAAALGLSVAVAPSLLSGKAEAATPKKGGHFIHAITGGSTTDTLDPATHTSSWNINVELQIRNCLVEVDHNFDTVPELAESWESSPDAKTWVFNLRKGVEFHDGKTLDAEDVIYSLNHHRGEDSKSAAKPYLASIVDLKADGKNRLIVELNAGNADSAGGGAPPRSTSTGPGGAGKEPTGRNRAGGPSGEAVRGYQRHGRPG